MDVLWDKALIDVYDQEAGGALEDTDALSCTQHGQAQDLCWWDAEGQGSSTVTDRRQRDCLSTKGQN